LFMAAKLNPKETGVKMGWSSAYLSFLN